MPSGGSKALASQVHALLGGGYFLSIACRCICFGSFSIAYLNATLGIFSRLSIT